ncbi:MAG: UbiA-like polyprenyltransferase [Acidobacteriota bacterium]
MGWSKFSRFLDMIDFQHTIFGLPFAYLGAFLALPGFPGWAKLFWITLAMVSARTAALCMNRAIDVQFDKKNPRTAGWALAKGEFHMGLVWVVAVLSVAVLVWSAWELNPLCLKLSPLAVIALFGYSYTKRFTWWCHLLLGLAIGIGPVGAWIAVTGTFPWEPILLTLAIGFWIGGFDTMYACQDIEFDRREGLYSIPARFGAEGALRWARAFHVLTIVFFAAAGWATGRGLFYYLGVAFAAMILIYEHTLISPEDLRLANFAAFKVNRFVSLAMFVMALIDIFM